MEQLIGDSVSQSFILDILFAFFGVFFVFYFWITCVRVGTVLLCIRALDFFLVFLCVSDFINTTDSVPMYEFIAQATTLSACVSVTCFLFTACCCVALLRRSSTDLDHINCSNSTIFFFFNTNNIFVYKMLIDNFFV